MEGIHVSATDTGLIDACLAGNDEAWHTLVHRYKNLVYSIPRKFGLGAEVAAEIFAAVWQDCWEELPALQDPERLKHYLIQRTLSECQCRAPRNPVGSWEIVEDVEREQTIRTAVGKLSPKKQEVVQLFLRNALGNTTESHATAGLLPGFIQQDFEKALSDLMAVLRDHPELGSDTAKEPLKIVVNDFPPSVINSARPPLKAASGGASGKVREATSTSKRLQFRQHRSD